MKTVIKTILMNPYGDILFLVRSATHPRFAHETDLPGGIIEKNESARTALIREVSEECNIDISDKAIYKVDELQYGPNWRYILAVVINDSILPHLSWEHEEYYICNIQNIQSNNKLSKASDPYIKFVYRALCRNIDKLSSLISKPKN